MKRLLFLLVLTSLLISACGEKGAETPAVTLPTIPTAEVPISSDTPQPTATITSTPVIISGVLTTQVNVRSGPGVDYPNLGILESGQVVQVTGVSTDSAWYQIQYTGNNGIGWVAAQFVDTAGKVVPTLTPQGGSLNDSPGTVTMRLNVRSGPGTNFNTLGVQEVGATVSLTGKNDTGAWLQIIFTSGPSGRGWITAQYVQTSSLNNLPVINEYGTPITPAPGATTPAPGVTITATIGPAPLDGDSSAIPLARVLFSPVGTKSFDYQDSVSHPDGDAEDWIEITPFASGNGPTGSLSVNLGCSGNGSLIVELYQNGTQVQNWGSLMCGDIQRGLLLPVPGTYQFRFRVAPGSALQYVYYYLRMRNNP